MIKSENIYYSQRKIAWVCRTICDLKLGLFFYFMNFDLKLVWGINRNYGLKQNNLKKLHTSGIFILYITKLLNCN